MATRSLGRALTRSLRVSQLAHALSVSQLHGPVVLGIRSYASKGGRWTDSNVARGDRYLNVAKEEKLMGNILESASGADPESNGDSSSSSGSSADGSEAGAFYTASTLRRRISATQTPDLVMNVKSTKNNTHVQIMDAKTHISVAHVSSGAVGYSGAKRSGFEPAFQATVVALQKAIDKLGLPPAPNPGVFDAGNVLWFKFKGYSIGRDAAFRAVTSLGWPVAGVEDGTPIPYGGSRPKKQRRL